MKREKDNMADWERLLFEMLPLLIGGFLFFRMLDIVRKKIQQNQFISKISKIKSLKYWGVKKIKI